MRPKIGGPVVEPSGPATGPRSDLSKNAVRFPDKLLKTQTNHDDKSGPEITYFGGGFSPPP